MAGIQEDGGSNNELPAKDLECMEARECGGKLCDKSASEWASEKLKDETARTIVGLLLAENSVEDTTEGVIPDTVDKMDVKRLVSQGESMELPNSQKV